VGGPGTTRQEQIEISEDGGGGEGAR
jgi:hypothetical protein